jgi:membrane protease YdiL (CAAX protease family)
MKTASPKLIIAQIFIIFILPVALLYFRILPADWRVVLLTISSIFIYGIIRHEHWTHEDMGVRHDNFKKAFPFYLFFTILGIVMLFLIDHKIKMPNADTPKFIIKNLILFLPVSFFQEFAFRSFLMPRLKKVCKNVYCVILLNAVLFTLVHIIYPKLGIGLPIAFFSGIFFAWLYFKYPNLILISVSHALLNLTAVLLGFFNMH